MPTSPFLLKVSTFSKGFVDSCPNNDIKEPYHVLCSSTGYDPDSLPYFKIFPEYVGTVGSDTTLDIPGTCWYSAQVTKVPSRSMVYSVLSIDVKIEELYR